MAWSEKVDSIISCGISLHDAGVSDWALTKEQALSAFDSIEKEKMFVLGGDVYQMVSGAPESNYDNWYCDRNEGEDEGSYLERCISKARQYVTQYQHPNGQKAFFVLVVE